MTKIIGFQSKDQLGILKAFKLKFDPDTDRVVKIKGATGEGKTTAMDGLKMCVHGKKVLQDKTLRGIVNIETQVIEGEHNLFVGFKPDGNGSFESYLYERDSNGKKIKEPTIEGVKYTPSAWQKLMTNELTWNYAGFTSPNPSEHKNTLLKLFQSHLKDVGVVFDTKSSEYKGTILHQIDEAINARSYADMKRKEVGGVADDLKDNHGIDVNRPATYPARIDVKKYDARVAEINKALGNLEADKKSKLQDIRFKASELEKEAMVFNDEVDTHNSKVKDYEILVSDIEKAKDELISLCEDFVTIGVKFGEFPEKPKHRQNIIFSNGKISGYNGEEEKGKSIIDRRNALVKEYQQIDSEPISDEKYQEELKQIEVKRKEAEENNKICDAIDLFKDWQEKDGEVKRLQNEYVKLLASIDIGVEGMKIIPDGTDIFLKYNGCHDPEYFRNQDGEYRKLNEYSGSQRPMIVLLLQSKLLEKRKRALRYMFIDDVPIDKKTQKYLDKICQELNLWVFVNINGDFEAKQLESGEILIEGGEMFAANADMISEPDPIEVEEEKPLRKNSRGNTLVDQSDDSDDSENEGSGDDTGFSLF